jgi:hypothetical protein
MGAVIDIPGADFALTETEIKFPKKTQNCLFCCITFFGDVTNAASALLKTVLVIMRQH